MPTKSQTGNVTKHCACAKRASYTCKDPWQFAYQKNGKRTRGNLDTMIGWHAPDLTTAQNEAARVIAALAEDRDPRTALPQDDPTVADLLTAYARERPRSDRWQAPALCRTPMRSPAGLPTFGEWRASAVTVVALREFRRKRPRVAGNRDMNLLRAAFNWGVLDGLVASTPFRKEGVPTIQKQSEQARTRRLLAGEYEALLGAATKNDDATMADVIVAAIESGMRKGEIASLQWWQVTHELFLPAAKTKTKKDRRVPISPLLREVLDSRRRDPAGALLPPSAYVFGDETGACVEDRKRAWLTVVLRAHGHTPHYNKNGNLLPDSRAALKAINLHFHDLRREAGSRWMDAGVPLATIQRWLGHANISQTSTYLGASLGDDARDMAYYVEQRNRLAHPGTLLVPGTVLGSQNANALHENIRKTS